MELGLHQKRCLVTGGCNGIGAEITKAFLREGAEVVATTRAEPKDFISTIGKKYRENFSYIKAELSTDKGIQDFIDNNHFNYDILINNAGHTLNVKDPYCSIENWKRVMNLNFYSCVQLVNTVVPYMQDKEWGRIVNITSCAGLENSGPVTFTTAKASLTAYTRSMGRCLAIDSPGVVMTAVYPGVIITPGGHWDEIIKNNPSHAEKYISERCPPWTIW